MHVTIDSECFEDLDDLRDSVREAVLTIVGSQTLRKLTIRRYPYPRSLFNQPGAPNVLQPFEMLRGLDSVAYAKSLSPGAGGPSREYAKHLQNLVKQPTPLEHLPRIFCQLDDLVRPLVTLPLPKHLSEAYEAALNGDAKRFELAKARSIAAESRRRSDSWFWFDMAVSKKKVE